MAGDHREQAAARRCRRVGRGTGQTAIPRTLTCRQRCHWPAAGGLAGNSPAGYGTQYLGLNLGDPGGTGANEVNSGTHPSYARVALNPANYGPPTGTPNVDLHRPYNALIQWAQATSNWGLCTHWSLWTAATGGSFIKGGTNSPSLNVVTGIQPQIASGGFKPEQD